MASTQVAGAQVADPRLEGWPVLPLEPGVALRITREMPVLDPALDAVVEAHWQEARRRAPLFNGRVFCADRITPGIIEGHWTEYRREMAQIADHGLFDRLRVRCLAVCGVIWGPDGVAVGRRDRHASYQAGMWQLPPAGSVDNGSAVPGGADWRLALLGELEEEMGIGAAEVVGRLRPLCLVQHPSGVLDMGVRIDVGLAAAEILERQARAKDQEYEAIFVSPAAGVAGEVARRNGVLVPPAHAFLARAAEL